MATSKHDKNDPFDDDAWFVKNHNSLVYLISRSLGICVTDIIPASRIGSLADLVAMREQLIAEAWGLA